MTNLTKLAEMWTRYIGIEKMARYVGVSHERLAKVQPALMESD